MRSLLSISKPVPVQAPKAQDTVSHVLDRPCYLFTPVLLTPYNGELGWVQGGFCLLPYFIQSQAQRGTGGPEAESGPRADFPSPGWPCSPQATSTPQNVWLAVVGQGQAGGAASALEAEGRWGPYPDTPGEGHRCRQPDRSQLCTVLQGRCPDFAESTCAWVGRAFRNIFYWTGMWLHWSACLACAKAQV